jgi:carbon-monoxide dehydrogenase large subunit
MPGVLGILTGQDCAADGLSPIPHNPVPQTRYDMKLTGPGGGPIFIGPQMLLPSDRVRHVGEAVAVVVAETALQAQDAAEEVAVDYRELPWIAQIKDALTPGATAVWDEVPDNVLVDTFFGDAAATERAFAIADHIIEMEFHVGRVTGVPMEPRAALGHWDTATGRGTLWAGSGGAVRQKTELAEVLGVPPDRVRVVSLDVGGNFGTRNRLYVESGLVLWASRKLGRPVKYTSTRSEVFLTDFQGRDLLTRVALAIPTASFSDCAPTMSAMLALAAHRCRRSARGRPWSPAPMIFRPRPYARAPSSPTRCQPMLTAARAGPKSPMRSSGSSTRPRAGWASTALRCAA